MIKRFFILVLICVIGCAAQDTENISSSHAALDLPAAIPVPKGWDGSQVDLYVADAWVGCSFEAFSGQATPYSDSNIAEPGRIDAYLTYVLAKMTSLGNACGAPPDPNNPLRQWYLLRGTKTCNTDSNNADAAYAIEQTALPGLRKDSSSPPTWSTAIDDAVDDELRKPGINLCVAQRLRLLAPSATNVAALTLNGDDQRTLTETIRERATIAVLGYDAIAQVLAAPRITPTSLPTVMQGIQIAVDSPPLNALDGDAVGNEYAEAVQLLSMVSDEMLNLYFRSASARIPRGGDPQATQSTDMWDSESWRTRALASLFGGDPLAASQHDVPWSHFSPSGTLISPPASTPAFVSTNVLEPQVTELQRYAQRYDVQNLKAITPTNPNSGCYEVDFDLSARQLYRSVEAGIRTTDCVNVVSNACQTFQPGDIGDPGQGFTDYLLWTRHQISLDHARTLVHLLADEIGRKCVREVDTYETVGGMDVEGANSLITVTGQSPFDGTYYHIAANAAFVPHTALEEHAARYQNLGGFTTESNLQVDIDDADQGYAAPNWERRRLAGSAVALAATRRVLDFTRSSGNGGTTNSVGVLAFAKQMLDIIQPSVGTSSTLEPSITRNSSTVTTPSVDFVLYATPDDPFWDATQSSQYTIQAVGFSKTAFGAPLTAQLTATVINDASFSSFTGVTLATIQSNVRSSSTSVTTTTLSDLGTPLVRWTFGGLDLSQGFAYQLIAKKGTSYKLIGSSVGGHGDNVVSQLAAHFPVGGALGQTAQTMLQPQTENPSQSMYDAFGYEIHRAVPNDPYLSNQTQGSDVLQVYLTNAHNAANTAVSAVTAAFQTLLQEEAAQLSIQQQVASSQQVLASTQNELCGPNNATCDTSLVNYPIIAPQTTVATDVTSLNADCNNSSLSPDIQKLACFVNNVFGMYKVSISMAKPVVNVIQTLNPNKPGAQSFPDYQGGSLQANYIAQFDDYELLEAQLDEFYTGYKVAAARVDAANAVLATAEHKQQQACDPATMVFAAAAGVSGGFASVSVSIGPLFEQIQKCEDLKSDLQADQAQTVLAFAQGMDDMHQTLMRVADAGKALGLDVANGNALIQQATEAKTRAALDAQLAVTTNPANGELFRRYHNYEIWRATALLENARRYAVIARRAIEARYVVDLSTMAQPEPFVASPATWADSVYAYDLNMPAAVGLTTGGQQSTGSVYPNAISDYVDNLQRFVDGYAIQRPSASTASDTDIITLPGPLGIVTGGTVNQSVIDNAAYKWSFFCPSANTWKFIPSNGNVDMVCGTESPSFARLDFGLDAWGRVDGASENLPFTKRYNTRWNRLALNVVGTGILDCTKASDPLACYAQEFIPYDMTHVGPCALTNFDELWRAIDEPRGQIEGAKGLTAEQWLDPLENGWSKPYVSAIGRTEFVSRPIGGAYRATFHTGPEVTLGRIERIQLLLDYAYWVKQQ